jgi:glycosyltransferase involved in cell wall biosynthesis
MGKNLVMAIYSHPEYYPPTLNAIDQLAPHYDQILVLHRNITGFDWAYPPNVQLIGPEKLMPVRDAERVSTLKKIFWFIQFCGLFVRTIRAYKPQVVVLYDCIPVLCYRMTRFFFRKPMTLWYHNHDVTDPKYVRKFSISYFAWKSEAWIFSRLQMFTLPSVQRKEFFPMEKLLGEFHFLPNYPSLIRNSLKEVKSESEYRILYQGSIGPMHGLEQIIPLLTNKYKDRSIHLVLKGFCNEDYLNTLKNLADIYAVRDKIEYLPPSGYHEVIVNANKCHIGVGIFMKADIMNRTLGTASNKIYEYAAAGLPVLIYDAKYFRESIDKKDWTFFTDGSSASINRLLEEIINDFNKISNSARADFKNCFSFDLYFEPVLQILITNKAH